MCTLLSCCILAEESNSKSLCNELGCNRDFWPICAELNGNISTFLSECVLKAVACLLKMDYKIISEGKCETDEVQDGKHKGETFIGYLPPFDKNFTYYQQ